MGIVLPKLTIKINQLFSKEEVIDGFWKCLDWNALFVDKIKRRSIAETAFRTIPYNGHLLFPAIRDAYQIQRLLLYP